MEISKQTGAPQKSLWILYSVLLLNQILSSLAFPAAKIGLNEIDPLVYAFFRFLICSLFYLPILIWLRNKKHIPLKDHLKIFLIGLMLIPFNQVLFLIGQSMTSAGHSSLMFATIPIFIYIMAIIFLHEKATWRRSLGILIAAGGVYVILRGGKVRFGPEYLLGDLIILAAVMAWAGATIMAKPLAIKYGALRVTGHALVYGSAVYMPYGLYLMRDYDIRSISWVGWSSIFYMAVVISVIAYVMWYWVLKHMEASRVAIAQNIQPIIATAVAAVVLSEPIGINLVIGGIIVISGVVLTEI